MTASSNSLLGRATAGATADYHGRHGGAPGRVRTFAGLSLSSVGLGTYLGEDTDEVDALFAESIRRALERGFNVLDAAINYRSQRSERVIGRVVGEAVAAGVVKREEVVVATKAGYIPYDGARPSNYAAYVEERYLWTGIIARDQLVSGVHCMSPRYLEDQIDRSRANLRLETIDIYYLHNPESHLEGVSREEFMGRLRAAFATFEKAVSDGRIANYGTATWHGFRKAPTDPVYHSLVEFLDVAREVGGADHHFKVVQLPYNLAMPEAHSFANQRLRDGRVVPFLQAARELGIYVMASAPILQGQLTERLPDEVRIPLGLETDSQRALQFVRSTPGIGTALAGMKRALHVDENAAVEQVPPVDSVTLEKLFELA